MTADGAVPAPAETVQLVSRPFAVWPVDDAGPPSKTGLMDNGARDDLPGAFLSPRALRRVNLVAVAATLAACTGVIATAFDNLTGSGPVSTATICAASTLAYGLIWAASLRTRFGSFPTGWFLAVPLAALNAGTSLGLALWSSPSEAGGGQSFLSGFFLGSTIGAFVWVPALLITLLVFGVPLALGQRAARDGLGSEERGERIVAIVAMALAAMALIGAASVAREGFEVRLLLALGATGLLSGLYAAIDATSRERSRRAFLHSVESGDAPGFRIDALPHQPRHLVRVLDRGEGYRAPRFAEPVAELDEHGEVKRVHEGLWG
ncbi:MAG: hypothetical protein JWM74_1550 [Myxococcaceae bacterium]|nr:hypothetical protein [Myxococcaceae bacterium]